MGVSDREKRLGRDIMWYIWLNKDSPLFGKDKMATFERYFLAEKETHTEKKNPYYRYLEDESVVNHILTEFGLPETGIVDYTTWYKIQEIYVGVTRIAELQ